MLPGSEARGQAGGASACGLFRSARWGVPRSRYRAVGSCCELPDAWTAREAGSDALRWPAGDERAGWGGFDGDRDSGTLFSPLARLGSGLARGHCLDFAFDAGFAVRLHRGCPCCGWWNGSCPWPPARQQVCWPLPPAPRPPQEGCGMSRQIWSSLGMGQAAPEGCRGGCPGGWRRDYRRGWTPMTAARTAALWGGHLGRRAAGPRVWRQCGCGGGRAAPLFPCLRTPCPARRGAGSSPVCMTAVHGGATATTAAPPCGLSEALWNCSVGAWAAAGIAMP